MKTQSPRRKNGFTLVELLVVIAIIAVLASAGFTMGTRAILKGRQVSTLATATALESSVNNFFTEYGSMPMLAITQDTTVGTCSRAAQFDINFLTIMLGEEVGNAALNSKAIKFLTAREGRNNKDGLIYNSGSAGLVKGLFDPWGGPFMVMLDGDYDERLEVQPAAATTPTFLRSRRVAVWSNGADNTTNNMSAGRGKVVDDVKTWK